MKLIACSKCHSVVQLIQKRTRSCKCGNIKGRYTDKRNIEVTIKDRNPRKKSARIIMLPNSVRYGMKEKGETYIIPFDHECVTIKEEKRNEKS